MKKSFGNEFKKREAAFNQLRGRLPVLLGNEAVNHFQDNFTRQGFDAKKWKEVKRRQPGTPEYKYPKTKGLGRRTKAILVGTGTLRRDIQVKKATFASTIVGTSSVTQDYAKVQNEGNENIPARKFIGRSKPLETKMLKIIKSELNNVFK